MKIAITTSSFSSFSNEPMEILEKENYEIAVNTHGRKLTAEETITFLKGGGGVVAGTEALTREVLESLPELKVISRCGVGMDNVDLEAAKERGIAVCNTPFGPTLAVAELTLTLALNLLRRVGRMDRDLRAGVWKKRMGHTLAGKKLGILGFGRIGRAVAEAFTPHGVAVAYFDPLADVPGFKRMEQGDLLAWADIVSIHCSAPQDGRAVVGPAEIGRMKEGAWLINCARGGVVDEGALYEALHTGRLAGAAVDVFTKEPYDGPLTGLDNVILTPHVGSYARESRIQMEIDAVKNLIAALAKVV